MNVDEETWIQTSQAALLSPQAVAPEKALEAVWLGLVGVSALPAAGSAGNPPCGPVDKIDHLTLTTQPARQIQNRTQMPLHLLADKCKRSGVSEAAQAKRRQRRTAVIYALSAQP